MEQKAIQPRIPFIQISRKGNTLGTESKISDLSGAEVGGGVTPKRPKDLFRVRGADHTSLRGICMRTCSKIHQMYTSHGGVSAYVSKT